MQLPCKVDYFALMLVLVKCYDNKMVKVIFFQISNCAVMFEMFEFNLFDLN